MDQLHEHLIRRCEKAAKHHGNVAVEHANLAEAHTDLAAHHDAENEVEKAALHRRLAVAHTTLAKHAADEAAELNKFAKGLEVFGVPASKAVFTSAESQMAKIFGSNEAIRE